MSFTPPPGYVAFPPTTDGESPPTDSVYGPIFGAREVRQAVVATIEAALPTYLTLLSARTGVTLQPIVHWKSMWEYRSLPADQTPDCWVTCPGTDPADERRPYRDGTGLIHAWWVVDAAVVVYGEDWAETADLVNLYNSAIRACVMQNRSLGGFAADAVWLGDSYSEKEHQAVRTIGVGVNRFSVHVNGALNTSAPAAAGGAWPTVEQINIAVEAEPLPGPADDALPDPLPGA